MNKKEFSLLIGLILTIAISVFLDTNYTASKVRENTLRLHIIAASDSNFDQKIKLQVRDEILKLSKEIYSDTNNLNQALESTEEYMPIIQAVVTDTLNKYDIKYSASCSIEQYYFATTKYTDFILPQGEYTALTIKLGESEGKNWWCVVYPSLCIGSATDYEDDQCTDFIKSDSFEFKFKAVEIFEDAKKIFTKSTKEEYDKL